MTKNIEDRIELALENSDHHTLTEIALELEDDELLKTAKRIKQEEHDAHFGYDEARDNGEV